MVGGVISDIYHAQDRNTPMALFSASALFGTGLAPLISGVIVSHTTWRWVFYSHAIVSAAFVVIIYFFFKETRGSVLLSRKAQKLNKYYEALEEAGHHGVILSSEDSNSDEKYVRRIRWKVKSDEERASLLTMIQISVYRPFRKSIHSLRRSQLISTDMLVTEPVVFFFSLWVSFSWAVLYLQFSSVPLIFRTNHNFTTEQTGAVFTSMCVGVVLISIISIYQERVAAHFGIKSTAAEGRLYFVCVESVLLPIGLFWFGWTSFPSVPWIVPAMAVGCATMGIFSIYLATFNYLADTYHRYASSAIAAQSFCKLLYLEDGLCCPSRLLTWFLLGRNLLGGIFPLVTNAMFNNLGYPEASSLLGALVS
jgi:hypothetical protein